MKFRLMVLTLLAGLTLGLGCERKEGSGTQPQNSDTASAPISYPYKVTCTISMITDIVRQVAGEHATVHGIMAEGVDPHLYKPTRDDVAKINAADVVFYNGLNLEGKMGDMLVKVATKGKMVAAVTELLEDGYTMTDELQHFDPHVWMDVQGWIRAVKVVENKLSEFDPSNAAAYESNAATYIAELEKLDAYAKTTIASIPEQQRVLVTAHDAFSYMARAYNLEVRGVQGLSTESEAGVRDINDLVQYIVDRKIGAVFVETSVAEKNVHALIEGANAQGHKVVIGGKLFSDAMGKTGSYEGTYIGMIDHNVTTIVRALGGEAPAGGFQGKLSGTSAE